MPSLTRKPARPEEMVICLMSHAGAFGLFREDDKLRADHPAVKAAPKLWVEDGLDAEELHAAKMRLVDSMQRPVADEPAVVGAEGVPFRIQKPARPDEMVVLLRDVTVPMRGGGGEITPGIYQRGALIPRDHPIAKQYPDFVRPATQADLDARRRP